MKLDLSDAIVVITGAAGGVGAALARRLSGRCAGLALIDRDQQGLNETRDHIGSGVRVSTHVLDLADPSARETLPSSVRAAHGRATVLINNAGVAIAGAFEDYAVGEFEWLMSINFWAGVHLTRGFLPMLRQERASQLVFISSIFGIIGTAGNVGYSASKFAIRGFGESLRQELRRSPVGVTMVHPGGVNTNIARHARVAAGSDPDGAQRSMEILQRSLRMPADRAAAAIVAGIEARKSRVLVGIDAHILDALQRLAPGAYGDLVVKEARRWTPESAKKAD